MSKKIKDTEYLFLSGMLAARSSRMLTHDKLERMLDAGFEEAAKLLEESGYEDMSEMTAVQIEQALAEHRGRILGELARLSPTPELVDIFRVRYDYHNAKVMIKATAANLDGSPMLSGAGRVPAQVMVDACNSDLFSPLPTALAAAIVEARGVLARTGNPQNADILLDKACYGEMAEMAKKVGSPFLQGYVRFLIDSVNLRTAVRVVRIGGSMEFLRSALLPGGSVGADWAASAAFSGELGSVFSATTLTEAASAAAETVGGGSLAAFELLCEQAQSKYLSGADLVSFGEEPVVAYIARLENEITSVRMILTGLLAGVAPERIRERLR